MQRDWQQWFSNDDHAIAVGESDTAIVAAVRFDNEENVLSTDPANNSLLRSGSTARTNDAHNQVMLQLVGRDGSDPRVAALLEGSVADRCLEMQSLLPSFIPDGL